jgi:hypothetical protein
MENKSKPRKMKELIRIEDFNPEHVNGLFNQFECEVIKSGKGYYFKLTIKEQAQFYFGLSFRVKVCFKYRGSRKFGTLSS